MLPALQIYRDDFNPSQQLDVPYVAAGVNVFAADTDAQAKRLLTSAQQQFTNLIRGTPGRIPPPIDDIESYWSPVEKLHVASMLACSFVGSRASIGRGLMEFLGRTGVDELIVASAQLSKR